MIYAIYREAFGKADIDILATRGEDITTATRTVASQSPDPGGVTTVTLTRIGALLEAAQRTIDSQTREHPESRPEWSAYKDDAGFVRVTWIEA